MAWWSTQVLIAALGIVFSFGCAAGCERSAEASRVLLAQRRASWVREMGGIKEQHAALAARLAGAGDGSAAQRTRAVVDGTRQSIADVENQLAQAEGRIEQAIRRGGDVGQSAIDDETVHARESLQALGGQLVAASKQLDDLTRSGDEAMRKSP